MEKQTIIKTKNVSKVFNPGMADETKAVADVTLKINRAEVTVLKGPSGSGKTTLLSLLGCMARPTMGSICIKDKDVAKLPERFLARIRRRTFGFIFQQYNLIKDISVIENVMLPLYPLDVGLREIKARAEGILDDLNILNKRNMKIQRLSGGEQQRVAIARALINQPEIILADEPTAHLDTKLSGKLLDILQDMNSQGKTVIIGTHDPLVYESDFVDRVVEMRDGMVQQIVEHNR
ncbi:MAG: ABC transporter ATP-binding protein [Desulfobacteraceae bacterium]|jgi:putative ABC transport system ATP-binding protein